MTGADEEEVLVGFIRIRRYGTMFGVILGCLGAARTVGPKWLEKVLEVFPSHSREKCAIFSVVFSWWEKLRKIVHTNAECEMANARWSDLTSEFLIS